MTNEKYRLIRFNQREKDNLRTEGSDNDKLYPWTLRGEELKTHSIELIQQLNSIVDKQKPQIKEYPYVYIVNINENAKAKSHQSKLISMFNVDNSLSQLGMISEDKLIIKLKNEQSIKKATENLAKLTKNQNSISAITEIKEFEPTVAIDEEEDSYKVNFIDFHDEELNQNVLDYVEKKLTDNNISFKRQAYSKDYKVLELMDVTLDKLTFVRELPVKNIEPMPSVESPFLEHPENKDGVIDFIKYDKDAKYPIVGLLDSGVTILPQLEGFVIKGKGCNYDETELNTNHGTFIANLLVHGNQINNVKDYSLDGCTVVDVPVVPKNGAKEPELIKNIETAIISNPKVKIWNLSVSLKGYISNEGAFSDFAIALDRIQDDYNVLICKSAGNDGDSYILGEDPKKISIGADSVRSLTVGSISRNSDPYGFCKANFPSPYSRVGRGPAEIIKPDLVHYGGDIFAKSQIPTSVDDYERKGEVSIIADGTERTEPGTSFSTPKVAKLLAELCLTLEMDSTNFNPLLLKALVVHSANYLENNDMDGIERLRRMGYGKPEVSEKIILQDTPHSATLMLSGNLRKKARIDIMDFPYPKNLVKDGRFTGKLKVTLVYNNYLSKDMGPEYCQSDLLLRMGTYDRLFDRDTTKPTILNPVGRKDSENILKKGIYGKKKIDKNIDFLKERNLIEFGDKYYPVKKFSADLDEIKDSVQKSITEEKKWFLFLEGKYRDFIYQEVERDDSQLSMDYVLLITILDPTQTKDVYTDVIRELEYHNFEYDTIDVDIDNQIDIEIVTNQS